MKIYKLEVIEHFEDWFVCDDSIGEYALIDEAISSFINERRDIVEMERSTDGIDQCISENFEDENDANKYNKGFILKLYIIIDEEDEEEEIASEYFEYDLLTHSIKPNSIFELNNDNLTVEEATIINLKLKPT